MTVIGVVLVVGQTEYEVVCAPGRNNPWMRLTHLPRNASFQRFGRWNEERGEGAMKKKSVVLASAVLTSIALLSGPAGSQGAPQTVGVATVDAHKLSAGYRASKVIGSTVLNNADESIGKIDDILVSSDGKEPHAVISVGSFLGMGGRLIILRYDSLTLVGSKVVPASGARDRLKVLPGFNYAVQ